LAAPLYETPVSCLSHDNALHECIDGYSGNSTDIFCHRMLRYFAFFDFLPSVIST